MQPNRKNRWCFFPAPSVRSGTHVIQMDIGSEADVFVHRAGRTGRAGKTGIHVVFGDEFELRRLAVLEKQLGITVYPKILWGGKILRPEDLPSENQ